MANARAMIAGLILVALVPAQGAAPPSSTLADSIKEVATAPQLDVPDPSNPYQRRSSRPFISRRALKAGEQAAGMEFEVTLKLRNFSELQARVGRNERISPEEMAVTYNPSAADYARIRAWLSSQGFEITRQDKNNLAIFARGSVSQIQNALQMSFARVAVDGEEYTSGITAPNVPSDLAPLLVGINGLQPHIHMHKHLVLRPNSLTDTNPPYLPRQIAQAYNATGLYNSNITGSGQTIAIAIDTFPSTSDLQSFWTTYGVKQSLSNITFIQVIAGTLPRPSGEETLDTEWSSSIAPGAKVRVYASRSLSFSNLDQVYQQIYTDVTTHPEYGIHQMSMSYGIGEKLTSNSQVQTDDQYFAELASAGVTIFASSGDSGSTPGQYGAGDETGAIQTSSPASDPNVTSVGGTSLTLDAGGNAASESVWNNGYGAGGGGISIYFNRPSWQAGSGVPSGTTRLVPDVSSSADPLNGAAVIMAGSPYVFGGTSWSSPMWAGFNALINQNRANASLAPIGLLGPAIYPLIGAADFRDITVGNNATAKSGGVYATTAGYDLASGIGVPNVQALAQSLLTSSGAPVFTNGPPPVNASTGIAYSFSYTAIGRPAPVFSIATGSLPPGLNLSSDGVISGTPSQSGLFSGTVSASNGVGSAAVQAFSINVHATLVAPTFANGPPPATAAVGSFYNFTYSGNGTPDPTFALSSGTLPPGLSLTSAGVLSGTPTQLGVYSGSIAAGNGVNPSATQNFTITVQQAPAFTDGPPPSPTPVNTSYNFAYAASGNPAPTFSLTSGSLPPGLTLTSAGVLSGTTTQTGAFTGTVTADNGVAPAANQSFSINVQPSAAPIFTNAALSTTINTNTALNFLYAATGLPAPTFSLASGSLPAGVTLSTSGVLSGTPTQAGTYTGTVTASNGVSPSAMQNFSIIVQTNIVQQYAIIHDFFQGFFPQAALILGADGNFYGTTTAANGGKNGTVYKMTPQGTVTVLHTFGDNSVAHDGADPSTLVLGSDGNFYGVTEEGGSAGLGTVYKMTPQGAITILHSFGDGTVANDGANPMDKLIEGAPGIFYGTAFSYGAAGGGTIYKITSQGVMTVLHAFGDGSIPNDGGLPNAGLILGPDGNFYGTTQGGGSVPGSFFGAGTVYKMTPQGAVTIIHLFEDNTNPNDGAAPQARLVLGSDGNFYGVTSNGGVSSQGTIFKMTPDGTVTNLHRFGDGTTANDGRLPYAALVEGSDGNFYGTTIHGGLYSDSNGTVGTIFQISPQGAFKIIHDFGTPGTPNGDGGDGGTSLFQGPDGNFYGTTIYGGSGGLGVAYKLTLAATPAIISAPPTTNASAGVGYNFSFQVTGTSTATYALTSGSLPPGLALSSSGILSGIPTAPGTYTGTITATSGSNPGNAQAFMIAVAPQSFTSFSSWAGRYALVNPIDIPENDGVPNLLKYVCDIDPSRPMTASDRSALPILAMTANGNLTLTYREASFATGVTLTVQTSSDLQTWTTAPEATNPTAGSYTLQPTGTFDLTTGDPYMKIDFQPAGASPQLFIRLNVIQP